MANLPFEPEFEQACSELASTLDNSTLFLHYPEYRKALRMVAIPERVIQFRVVWEDDKQQMQVNRGYRVQFNSALGPYKGGLRFHPTVNLSILKFLGFEQTFKNALTGLSMGGGKGGADFDPKSKSDNEIRKFCVAFMTELCKHVGADTDVPAGDIGVSTREIGYMFGQYKKIRNQWEGVLTGKGVNWGGSFMRPEATGHGLIYYVQHMIRYASSGNESILGKRIAISGSGNVAQYAALKAIQLGAIVVSMSDSRGSLIVRGNGSGFTTDEIALIAELKRTRKQLNSLLAATDVSAFSKDKFEYIEGARPWTYVRKIDIALPCATQNEISGDEAAALVTAGVRFVAEGSNMGCTQEAINVFESHRENHQHPPPPSFSNNEGTAEPAAALWYAPGKAANSGGVAVSGLEMAQNSARLRWSAEEVDRKLQDIMAACFHNGVDTAKAYLPTLSRGSGSGSSSSSSSSSKPKEVLPSLVAGSNIAGFMKVAAAMKDQGDWW